MSLHNFLGRHVPDIDASRLDEGHFVSVCRVCSRAMEKFPGLGWRLSRVPG